MFWGLKGLGFRVSAPALNHKQGMHAHFGHVEPPEHYAPLDKGRT